jgi:hypothetical protein
LKREKSGRPIPECSQITLNNFIKNRDVRGRIEQYKNGEFVMKSKWMAVTGIILMFACLSGAWAQDAGLKAKVASLYAQADSCVKTKNIEGYLALMTDDFQVIMAGLDREGSRGLLKILFASFDEFQVTYTPLEITQSGRFIKVIRDEKIQGKTANGDWKEVSNKQALDYLVQEGNSLKFARSADIDKTRLNDINGPIYKDEQSGLSLTAPAGWEIIPGVHPSMKGTVFVLAPDKLSMALIGYVKIPGISAQQAAEGDEQLAKILSKDSVYELYKSGPINVGAYEGFEIESRFNIPSAQDRHRRRVYFKAHGSLYVICFDAIPFSQWDTVKGSFQQILDSIKVED